MASHTATDTRSNAPARRDEDRVIRPLVRFVNAGFVSFASARARKLINSAASPLPAKSSDFAGARSWHTSPGQYHLSVPVFNCRRDSPYMSGQRPRVVVLLGRNAHSFCRTNLQTNVYSLLSRSCFIPSRAVVRAAQDGNAWFMICCPQAQKIKTVVRSNG